MIFLIHVLSAMLAIATTTADAITDVHVLHLLTIADVIPVQTQEIMAAAHLSFGFYFFFAAAETMVLPNRIQVVVV